jgi:DNA-binding HxlR family transcriptional regulator
VFLLVLGRGLAICSILDDPHGIISIESKSSPWIGDMNVPSLAARKVGSTIYIGKWTVSVLSSLGEKPYRHGELRRHLGSVSQRILTRTLRNLESAGLIKRCVTRSKSVAVEYSLTPVGKTFMKPLTNICRWANRYDKQLSATIRLT